MQAPDNGASSNPVEPGASEGSIRPILPEKSPLRTIVIVGPGRLMVKAQDAVDKDGFIEFAMASRDGVVFFQFFVRPNDACTQMDILHLARKAGNDLLLEAYAGHIKKTYKGGRYGKA